MKQEFCIYPRRCEQECDELKNMAQEMQSYRDRLETVKKALACLNGNGYSNVVSNLDSIIIHVETEKNNLKTLETVLRQSTQLYEQAETKITGTNITLKNTDSERDGWDDSLADIIAFLSDIRGSYLGVILESLSLQVIFADNVLKDIGKILSGTYLSSYWKDGRLYLKLKCDDLTNRQVTDWLEKNLGRRWDDYLARNMKRDGFAIFDKNDGILRDMRYFDDITETELLKYLDKLKDTKHLSFSKTFFNTFKEEINIFNDFNYKGFSDLSILGKTGKILGTAGTVLTLGSDAIDNLYIPETGTWEFSAKRIAGFALDVSIDVGAGAMATATGAAVGSLLVPPVGTVLGAGVGFAIDFAANNIHFADVDGDGESDNIIDIAKYYTHEAIDKGGDILDNILDWGADAVSDASDWFSEAFAF